MNKKKKLIVILGSNGVGKSSAAKSFITHYSKSAFVDSDWCRVMNPFPFTERTKQTVTDNIYCLIRNYLLCMDIDYVIFTYGFHGERKNIFDSVVQRLQEEKIKFELSMIILKFSLPDTEGEIGYWIGVPYWGQGFIPEAVNELLRHGFEDLELEKIWCGYFEGNAKSKRVQEKCGFTYYHTNKDIYWKLMDDIRTEHVTCMTRENWYQIIKKKWGIF